MCKWVQCKLTNLACCHTSIHVAAIPHHCHVSSHVIDYVNLHIIIVIQIIAMSAATSSSMSSMCDMIVESMTNITLFVMFIFVIKNGLGLGFGGSRTFYDGFEMSWIKQSMTKI